MRGYEIKVTRGTLARTENTAETKEEAIAKADEILRKNVTVNTVQVVENGYKVVYTNKKKLERYNTRIYRNNYIKLY